MNCPACAVAINITNESIATHEGVTLDCPNCDALLIIKEGRFQEFHPYLNKETKGEWPEDGRGTDYIEV